MSNKRKNRIRSFFKNIQKGSPSDKTRMTWFLVIIFMIGVFFLWVNGVKRNFSRMSDGRLIDLSVLPSLPETGSIDLDGALDGSGEELKKYLAMDAASRQAIGDEYIKEKQVLDEEDGFSSLKFVDSKEEDGAILLEYAQCYKDVPILGSGLTLSASADDGSVSEKTNNLVTGVDLVVDPEISLKAAGEIAKKEVGDGNYVFKEGSLAIVRYEGDFYLAWKVTLISDKDGKTKDILVGAQRGGVIPQDAVLLENEKPNQTSDIVE